MHRLSQGKCVTEFRKIILICFAAVSKDQVEAKVHFKIRPSLSQDPLKNNTQFKRTPCLR